MWLSRMIRVGRSRVVAKRLQRRLDPLEVVGVADPQHIPVIAEKAGRDILGEGEARVRPRW